MLYKNAEIGWKLSKVEMLCKTELVINVGLVRPRKGVCKFESLWCMCGDTYRKIKKYCRDVET